MKARKKLIAMLLSAAMVVTLAAPAMAAEADDVQEPVATEEDETLQDSVGLAAEEETSPQLEKEAVTISITYEGSDVEQYTITTEPSLTLDAVFNDEGTYEVSWTTDNEAVATVSGGGLVVPVSNGTANITASAEVDGVTISDFCEITVSIPDGCHQAQDGNWYVYKDGVVDTTLTGVYDLTIPFEAGSETGTYYVKDGKVMLDANAVVKDEEGSSWVVKDGRVNTSLDGVCKLSDYGLPGWYLVKLGQVMYGTNTVAKNKDNNTWWVVQDGKVNFSYTGLASNDAGTWYAKNGRVTFDVDDIVKGTVNGTTGWWHVVKSQVTFDTTVAKNSSGWYYVKDGMVDFGYWGFAKNSAGWWYIKKGKVDFTTTSVLKGTVNGTTAWWHVVKGKVTFDNTIAKNASGWWHIVNGKVVFDTTVAKNSAGWWVIQNGKINFNFWGLASNTSGTWYAKNGKVDFTFTGLAKSNGSWYYVKKGKVDYSFTGLASNSNGTFYVHNGKVDFTYNGQYTYNGNVYKITNGKVTGLSCSSSMMAKANTLSSNTKYLVLVDYDACRIGIFYGSKGNWTCLKFWACGPGKPSTPTPRGTYSVTGKGLSFGDGYTCWYYTQFYGNYLIHSVLYSTGSKTNIIESGLGSKVSHGCVRVTLENAKWVYDNVPYGSKVVVY